MKYSRLDSRLHAAGAGGEVTLDSGRASKQRRSAWELFVCFHIWARFLYNVTCLFPTLYKGSLVYDLLDLRPPLNLSVKSCSIISSTVSEIVNSLYGN